MRLSRALLSICVVFSTACASAPSGGSPAVPPRVLSDTLYPGDTRVDARRLVSGSSERVMTVERAGQPVRALGSSVDVLGAVTFNGAPALLRVGSVQRGTATLIDSTWSDPRTLAPLRHASVQPARRLFVEWTGAVIRGRVEPTTGAPIRKDSTFAVPSYDSSNWELVIRAMDLGVGVRRVLPVYDVDGLLQWYVVRVVDTTSVDGRAAWIVKADLGVAGVATMTIEQASRRLALVEVPMGQATLKMAPPGR